MISISEHAIETARKRCNIRPKWAVWEFNIKDNPHTKKTDHVIWHNAFYNECKILGRSI